MVYNVVVLIEKSANLYRFWIVSGMAREADSGAGGTPAAGQHKGGSKPVIFHVPAERHLSKWCFVIFKSYLLHYLRITLYFILRQSTFSFKNPYINPHYNYFICYWSIISLTSLTGLKICKSVQDIDAFWRVYMVIHDQITAFGSFKGLL